MNTYTLHINTYDLAFFGLIFTGLTFSLLLGFTKRLNLTANRFLAAALAVVVLWMIRILRIDAGLPADIAGWSRLPLQFSLALGPLIFFYVRQIIRPACKFRLRDLLHFIPLIVEICIQLFTSGESMRQGVSTYNKPLSPILKTAMLLSAFISVAFYLYKCHWLIENFYASKKFNDGDRHRHELRWLHNLLAVLTLLWLLWALFSAAGYFYDKHQSAPQVYYPFYLLLMVLMIGMAASAYLRPEPGIQTMAPDLKPLLLPDIKQKGSRLKKAVKENCWYQDPDLTLGSLAEKLNLHPHEVSRIINTVFKKSFTDFINEYRVKEAARKMQDPAFDHLTLLGIAFESGFNSQSSFSRIFRQMTGKSPLEYKNELKKEYPFHNLGSGSQTATVISRHETAPKWSIEKLNRNFMFKNYFKIAWRNLARNKSYTAINVTGLAVGIAVCMVIFIIIQFQTSFDTFHSKKDRIYRVLTEYHNSATAAVTYGKDLPFPLPLGLKPAFPQLEQVAPIFASQNDQLLIVDDNGITEKKFKEQRGVFFTGPSFFKIFDFPLLAGSYASLKDPNNVLLTKQTAERYFGDWKAAIGKTIKLQAGGYMFEHGTDVLRVSGILAAIPKNSDFQFKAVVAYGTGFTGSYLAGSTDWKGTVTDFGCYVLLPPGISVNNFNQQLSVFARKVKPAADKDSHIIQPLSAVHYDAQAGNYSNKTISHQLLNVLWLIAAFILLIACVNFVNLSTAQAINRAKEIGVRKVLGSNKSQLQAQFIAETFLIVVIAVTLAAVITIIALPHVNQLLELSLSFNIFSDPAIILFLLAVTTVVTALAGFYPSIILSRFNPIDALKSKFISNAGGISLRRGLVVFQFIIAQALIIGTLVIVKQMNYFMDQPLGFDKDAVINVPFRIDTTLSGKLGYLKTQLLSVNGVQTVSLSANTPIENGNDTWSTLKFNHALKQTDFKAITKFADEQYVPAYNLRLVAGKNLQRSDTTREFLVNESLIKSLGLKKPEDILGKDISIWNGQIKCPVVGVLKDFNNRSFHNDLAPLIITTDAAMYNQLAIKLATPDMSAALSSIKKIFDQTYPDFVYEYKFLDEKIAGFYKQENQLSQLYQIFATIAIFLSCLGLYGLASFMAVQRVKEVGIRKVLGASAGNIVYLFSKEFVVLIAIAFVIAAPVAWYYMHQWLQEYAYRISISWWLLAAGGLAALLIALATISFQAMKAAIANPVKSLRSE